MTISLDFIVQKTKEYYPEAEIFISHDLLINGIMLLDHQQSFNPDVLYIGKASYLPKDFPKGTRMNLLCTADCYIPTKYRDNNHINLLILPRNNSLMNIFNRINDLFHKKHRIREIKEKLMNCLFLPEALQCFVNTAYELMGHPVAIMVPGFKALACTNIELRNDEWWNHLKHTHYHSMDAVYFHKTSAEYSRCLMSRKPIICHTQGYHDFYNSNVYINNRLVAYIALVGNKEFDKNTPDILSFMSEIISVELQKNKYNYINTAKSYEFLFNDLLQEKGLTDQEINDRIEYTNLHLKQHLYVLTIDMSKQTNNGLTQTDFIDVVSMILDDCFPISFKSYVVILISRDSISLSEDNTMEKLTSYLKQMKLQGGLSLSFSYMGDLKKYFRQSKKALELSLHLNDKKVICKYEDYPFYHLAQICSKMTNIGDICHPCVISIRKYDEKNGTDLLESLYFYLKYEKSIHKAAQAMHVHRNTLYNRICKVKSIIEIDWNNYNVAKYIEMSIRILEYIESFSLETNDNIAIHDSQMSASKLEI